jgi:uncharacterized protein (TIGR03067 family)
VTRAEHNGAQVSKGLKRHQIIFTGKKVTFVRGDKGRHNATYKLHRGKKHRGIDITFVTGPDEGKTFKGIYQLKGDRLKLCWAESGQKRPKDFRAGAKSGCTLVVLKRIKP